MELTARTLDYMTRVVAALDADTLPKFDRTGRCPECGEDVGPYDGDHMFWVARPPTDPTATEDDVVVVIGCEGYWVIDPATVGLPRDQWQDYRMQGTEE